MWNHLKKFLKVDLRYKWLLINLVFGTFFMIAPYIYMVPPDQQVLTLKGMLCWFGLNQAFFGIGGFMEEERMDGTFTNLFYTLCNSDNISLPKHYRSALKVISFHYYRFFSFLSVMFIFLIFCILLLFY